jgi:imidazolonepropionase-like amidohydrolase
MASSALGPMGALEVASLHGARFIGKEKDLGSIEVGKLADFMVLNANPLVDIRNTADIQFVVKGGVVYDDETLDEVWPRQRKYGVGHWVIPDALKQDDKPIRP